MATSDIKTQTKVRWFYSKPNKSPLPTQFTVVRKEGTAKPGKVAKEGVPKNTPPPPPPPHRIWGGRAGSPPEKEKQY